jgi:hypothetical protein
MVFIAVIAVRGSNTAQSDVFGFGDYIFTMIFNDRPVISFGTSKIDKKLLTFLELPRSNTADTATF